MFFLISTAATNQRKKSEDRLVGSTSHELVGSIALAKLHFTICLPISSTVVENRPHQKEKKKKRKKKLFSTATDFFLKNINIWPILVRSLIFFVKLVQIASINRNV